MRMLKSILIEVRASFQQVYPADTVMMRDDEVARLGTA
jgi:hypothetical protein